jgi:hypothetical protein
VSAGDPPRVDRRIPYGQGLSATEGICLRRWGQARPGSRSATVGVSLFFERVLVDLLQVEGLPYLNPDFVPNHQLGQLFTVDEP